MLSQVEVLAPLEVLTLLKPRFLTGQDCAVESAFAVEALAPLLAGDAAAAT